MGIQVEYNPDLALRHIDEYAAGRRQREECLPQKIEVGTVYDFLKRGQRLYWLHGEIPLLETKGDQRLSRPIASIIILEATHLLIGQDVWTKGRYQVTEIIPDHEIRFNGFAKMEPPEKPQMSSDQTLRYPPTPVS